MASSVSESDITHADESRQSASFRSRDSTCFTPMFTSVSTSSSCENDHTVNERGDTQECAGSESSAAFPQSGKPETFVIDAADTLPALDGMFTDNTKVIRPLYKYVKNKKCLLCGFESKAKDPYSIRNHLFVHVTNKQFKCDTCGKKFHSMPSLKNHRFVHNGAFLFPCDACDKKFRSRGSLSSHKEMKHFKRRKFKCDVCDKIFVNNHGRKEHLRIHTGERPLVCGLCKKTFRIKKQLSYHIRRHHAVHENKRFPECGPSSNDTAPSSPVSPLAETNVSHSDFTSPFISLEPTCSKAFTDSISCSSAYESNINDHEEVFTQTSDAPHSRTEYAEERRPENVLKMDALDPSGEFDDRCTVNTKKIRPLYKYMKNNKCMLCGFESKSKNLHQIRSHLFVHVSDKEFKCDTCQKKFRQKRTLRIHRLIHKNVFPFSCDMCDKKYRSRVALAIHMTRTHRERRKFNCDICGKDLSSRWSLKAHLRIHTGELPFACVLCKKSFRLRHSLTKHLRCHSVSENPQQSRHCISNSSESA